VKKRCCSTCKWWLSLDETVRRKLDPPRHRFGTCAFNSYVEHGPGVFRELQEWRSPGSVCNSFAMRQLLQAERIDEGRKP
jgi:hypothetical protein